MRSSPTRGLEHSRAGTIDATHNKGISGVDSGEVPANAQVLPKPTQLDAKNS